jgi:hypothetical protein
VTSSQTFVVPDIKEIESLIKSNGQKSPIKMLGTEANMYGGFIKEFRSIACDGIK